MPSNSESLDGKIQFFEEAHEYIVKATGEKLPSVSSVIKKFTHEFDPNGEILKRKAAQNGITPEEMQKQWDKKRDDACEYGTLIHEQYEHFLNTGKIKNTPDKDIIRQLKKFKYKGKVYAERIVYSLHYGIAGCSDIIEVFEKENLFNVVDLKTNSKKPNNYSYNGKMFPPLGNFNDSVLQKYEFQLSIYCYLFELETNLWPNKLTLLWINPKTRKVEPISLTYRRKDVKRLLKAWLDPSSVKEDPDILKELNDLLN